MIFLPHGSLPSMAMWGCLYMATCQGDSARMATNTATVETTVYTGKSEFCHNLIAAARKFILTNRWLSTCLGEQEKSYVKTETTNTLLKAYDGKTPDKGEIQAPHGAPRLIPCTSLQLILRWHDIPPDMRHQRTGVTQVLVWLALR